MKANQIKWYRCDRKAQTKTISNARKIIPYQLPDLFTDLISICDAGTPCNTDFEYYDKFYEQIVPQALGCYLGLEDEEYNLLHLYKKPPEFFPEGLIAFAETGNGDFICFDYREGKDNPDPPIVYWNHEADVGKDVSFVAKNFEEFLGMLKEPDDEEFE